MNDAALFALFADMLEPLDDGHVQLTAGEDRYRPAKIKGANQIVVETFPLQTEFGDLQEYASALSLKYRENLASYLDYDRIEVFDGARPERVIRGTIDGAVGYLHIASMAYLSSENDGLDEAANLAVIQSVMQDVMADLKDTQAMIIDVRNNGGGHDEVSLAIASHFTDQKRLAGSKLARTSLGDTEPVEVYIEPVSDTPYLNPVVVIAGPETASAAETFLLTMSALPQVTLVGQPSNGILSDVLEKRLPNDWEIWLGNEAYFDYLGMNHEVTGVPPQVEAPVFSLDAIEAGRNAAIDTALQVLGF